MATARSLTLLRLSELLTSIDTSADILRKFIQKEQSNEDQDVSEAYSAHVANALGLPFHADPAVAIEAGLLRIACERLAQLVTPPRHLLFEAAGSFYTTLALKIAVRSEISTLIDRTSKETGQEGVHIAVLSEKTRQDADLLGRLLRHLSVSGIFQEIEPDIFANTTASSAMINNPEFNAHLDLAMHEGQLAAPFFSDLVKKRYIASQKGETDGDPAPSSSFALYTGGQLCYPWLHSPQNVDRGKNFNLAMRGMSITEGLPFLPVDYPFNAFPRNKLVVDVGGGIGSLPSLLLPSFPHLRFVVQDLSFVIAQAHEDANEEMKGWISEDEVKFETHDFFTPQPSHTAGAIFILKNIVHNYPDSKAIEILNALRPSNPYKLLIIDRLVDPHLRTEGASAEAEGAIHRNLRGQDSETKLWARSQRTPTMYDLAMAQLHGGRTRTLVEWRALLSRAGFSLDSIYPLRASTGQAILESTVCDSCNVKGDTHT